MIPFVPISVGVQGALYRSAQKVVPPVRTKAAGTIATITWAGSMIMPAGKLNVTMN